MAYNPRDYVIDLPQQRGPLDLYRDAMSLRELMDARRVRDLQVRRLELQEQEARREQEDYRRLQAALPSLGPESSLTDWISAGGLTGGTKGFLAQQNALKGQREAKEAAAKAEKEALEAAARRNLLLANKAEGYLWQDDPAERQRMYATDTPDFLKLGIITPEQAKAPLGDDKDIEAWVAQGKGREYLFKIKSDIEKRNEERADNKRKEFDEKLKLFGRVLGYVKTPEQWTQIIGSAPVEIRSLFPRELTPEQLPGMVQQATAMTMSPAERQAAAPKTLGEWQAVAVDPATSPAEKKIADRMVATLGAGQNAGTEAKYRDDYRSDKDVQNYIVRRDAWNEIQAGSQSQGGISDIKLIFNYIRMQDPGSTVREGESAMVGQAAGVSAQILNLYNRVVNGGKLPPEIRADILRESGKTYDQAFANYNKRTKEYREKAIRSGVNPDNVLIDYTPAIPAAAPGAQPSAGAPAATNGPVRNIPLNEVMPGRQPNAAPAKPKVIRPGDVIEGDDGWYRYDGGDQKDPKNFKKVRGK